VPPTLLAIADKVIKQIIATDARRLLRCMSPPAIDLEGFFFKRQPIGRLETRRLRGKFSKRLSREGGRGGAAVTRGDAAWENV